MTTYSTFSFVLHDVARLMRKRFEQHARAEGVTRAHWQVLSKLSEHEGIHQKGLADLLEIEPVTLTRLIAKMEERALLERRNHPTDRRQHLLYLTDKAHPLLELMAQLGAQTRLEATLGLTDKEQAQLQSLLDRMRARLIEICD